MRCIVKKNFDVVEEMKDLEEKVVVKHLLFLRGLIVMVITMFMMFMFEIIPQVENLRTKLR
jgi:hypothetical protein